MNFSLLSPGMSLIMCLNSKVFHLPDLGLCVVGLCFGISSSLTFGLSRVAALFYVGGILNSGFGVFEIGLRAFVAKIVCSDEVAKSNAIIGAMEGALLQLFGVIFSCIYNLTLDSLAGAFYFVISGCYAIGLMVTVWGWVIYNRANSLSEERKPLLH